MRLRLTLLCTAVLVVGSAGCSGGSTVKDDAGVYLSLGDSVAAGNGASDKLTTSFAALVARDRSLPLINLAVAGNTTADVISSQLPRVDEALAGRKLALITISVGGNDLAALIPNAACQQDPLPASCPLDAALAGVEERLDEIVRDLRAAHDSTPIVLLLYPNFFSGTGHAFQQPAARVLPQLDRVIERVASRYAHTAVANAVASFEGKGRELTHVLDPQFDPHPNDAGHRLIADAFIVALKEAG